MLKLIYYCLYVKFKIEVFFSFLIIGELMLVVPASSECMDLLGDLSASGHLVDVYNEASIAIENDRFIQSQQAKFLFEKYGSLFYNHLLAIAITPDFPISRFCEIYTSLSTFFEVTKFHPKFLFLNFHIIS
jgi:hypothetical protein